MEKISLKQFNVVVLLFLVGLISFMSCNESSIIGSDITNIDLVNVEVRELSAKATTVLADRVQTYRTTDQLNNYICGYLEDPLFGKYESVFNSQLRLSKSINSEDSTDIINFGIMGAAATTLDSAFFIVALADEFYGQITNQQEVEVYLLDEPMDNNATYFSDQEFTRGDLLGSRLFTPVNFDSIYVNYVNGTNKDTIIFPHMRIPLDVNNSIFRDVLFSGEDALQYYKNDSLLLTVLDGIQVKVSDTSPNEGLMIFDPIDISSVTGLDVHYTSVEDMTLVRTDKIYTFLTNEVAPKMVNFIPDYSGSLVEPFIGDDEYVKGDSLIFIQGMSGLNAKLEIQDFSSLQNVIINKAEIELTIANNLPEDKNIFSSNPISQLFIGTKNSDGELELISDIVSAVLGGSISSIFGGQPVEDNSDPNLPLLKYKMNITSYLQELVSGELDNSEIFLYPALRTERPERVAIFGPGHSQHPIKIYVTYTENQ